MEEGRPQLLLPPWWHSQDSSWHTPPTQQLQHQSPRLNHLLQQSKLPEVATMGGGYNPCSDSSSDFLVAWIKKSFCERKGHALARLIVYQQYLQASTNKLPSHSPISLQAFDQHIRTLFPNVHITSTTHRRPRSYLNLGVLKSSNKNDTENIYNLNKRSRCWELGRDRPLKQARIDNETEREELEQDEEDGNVWPGWVEEDDEYPVVPTNQRTQQDLESLLQESRKFSERLWKDMAEIIRRNSHQRPHSLPSSLLLSTTTRGGDNNTPQHRRRQQPIYNLSSELLGGVLTEDTLSSPAGYPKVASIPNHIILPPISAILVEADCTESPFASGNPSSASQPLEPSSCYPDFALSPSSPIVESSSSLTLLLQSLPLDQQPP